MSSVAAAFNPLDLSHTDDPYPRLAALRRERPVSSPLPGWHVVVRDADVRAVLAAPEVWSSRRNNTSVPDTAEADRELALSQLDPPAHTRLRRLLSPAFARTVVAGLEPVVRERATTLAGALTGEADLVAGFAARCRAPCWPPSAGWPTVTRRHTTAGRPTSRICWGTGPAPSGPRSSGGRCGPPRGPPWAAYWGGWTARRP
ncbi:hypothetical protein [Streptomyces sp. ST1015]|uniref:hypothetical protein n=1 Tax=Streptomyces sp. ST1015 TaxID=1848900 RepID=UPI00223ABB9B|nr:hypothetical protein [Streptomyces sp. ST1015]